MNMNTKTEREAAEFIIRLCGRSACLTSIANSYRQQAGVMRLYAEKAAKAKGA